MIRKILFVTLISWLASSCSPGNADYTVTVSTAAELGEAIESAEPGTQIVMADGEWNDLQIVFQAEGTERDPIVLRSETPGGVVIQGQSSLKLAGQYLVVDGLHFKNGASPSESVIQFFIDDKLIANNSRVTNCVIEDFNKAQRNMQDVWVRFKGRDNQLDHCYLAGKSNKGPTIRVNLKGNESINNYHKINNNHFGFRPPKGGPSAETIQIGASNTSMAPSYTQVYNNLFDRCNGEVEIISSKSNFNEFRNNVFYKSEGSLVTRHGNYCTIDGNYFIGDESASQMGGIRLIGTGHWVTNNYFYQLQGEIFRAPIAIMNGIPKSSINRYIQVTDVNVAYNTFVNCKSPLQFGVGSNVDQKDVLPASEIRSLTPVRTTVANNIIYNEQADMQPIVRHDSIDGIKFASNLINNQGGQFRGVDGLVSTDFSMLELEKNIWAPGEDLNNVTPFEGFGYEQITKDLFGNSRAQNNMIGATVGGVAPEIMDQNKYGPKWFDANASSKDPVTHKVSTAQELSETIEQAAAGDIIELTEEEYQLESSLSISKKLTIKSVNPSSKSTILFSGADETPAFEMNPKGELVLENVILTGNGKNLAFATLKEGMSSLYNLELRNVEIENFDYVLKAYKYSFAEYIEVTSSTIKNCKNGFELSSEDDDRGEYNAENIFVKNSQFENISQNVIDYYRGGYDESTVGGNLVVEGSTFTNCGAKEKNEVLLNTYGIINVSIAGNTFENNQVKLIARLWGAKNNSESNNTIRNSGSIVTEQNLPLKLMY